MKRIRQISRILVGIVFIFSGFVKAIDPLGSTYKFIDYFNAFHIGFFEPFALPLAIALSCIELLLGISLFMGYRMKLSSWVLLMFMSFFTVLTFILALTNPVHDCGCFGDALILTNWQTFFKNIVIMVFTLIVFFQRSEFPQRRRALQEYSILFVMMLIVAGLSLYCYRNLPVIDFRPYKTGTYIPDAMIIPEGSPENVYETTLIYRNLKTGKEEKFSLDNFPEDKEKWEFVDAVSELVSEGYEPPIHDFGIYNPDGDEITPDILSSEEYSLLFIAYDLDKADPDALIEGNKYFHMSLAYPDLDFYAITSSLIEKIDSFKNEFGLEYDFFQADDITLKTIVRSNPGLMLIHDGTILAKWHYRNMPLIQASEDETVILSGFPFCKGCDLREINRPPEGAGKEVLETLLYYRNKESGNLEEFSMEDFPANSEEWEFVESRTVQLSEGYKGPLHSFQPVSLYEQAPGLSILEDERNSLMFFIRDVEGLDDELFQKIQKLGGMASDIVGETSVYAFVPEQTDLISVTENYLLTFEYYQLDSAYFKMKDFSELKTVMIRDGKVFSVWKDEEIPDVEELSEINAELRLKDAGMVLAPLAIEELRISHTRLLVISFAGLFLLGISLINILLRPRGKH